MLTSVGSAESHRKDQVSKRESQEGCRKISDSTKDTGTEKRKQKERGKRFEQQS